MTTQHTPGPWEIESIDEVGYSIHGQPIYRTGIKAAIATRIGKVTHVFEGIAPNAGWQPIPKKMNLANARLIAAAPDLLEALEMALGFVCLEGNDKEINQAKSAIAKATGAA